MSVLSPKGHFLDYTSEESLNGAKFEFILYDGPQDGEHYTDRMQMLITPADGERRGFMMNVQDVGILLRGLSRLLDNALACGYPVSSDYEELLIERGWRKPDEEENAEEAHEGREDGPREVQEKAG